MTALNFFKFPKAEKSRIFSEIQKQISLPPAAIEKDWWVVQTLKIVFQMKAAPYLVFKGGTSLSKAWGIIERFSEDIDLALSRDFLGFSGNISRTQVGKLRDASFKYISEAFLPELRQVFNQNGYEDVKMDLIEVKSPDQDPVKIAIRYPSVTHQSKYINPQVILEIGSRAMREPFTHRQFCSFVGEIFAGQPFADPKINIPCVNPERTYLEKLFLLHEEFQRLDEKIRVKRLSRHLYDIHHIANTSYAEKAMSDKELYKNIVKHRERFSRLGGIDYRTHFPPQLNPIPPDEILAKWEDDYKTMQSEMIYGESMPFDQLIDEIRKIVKHINQK